MSKLDELIKELCPNGVEYKELKDICEISRGKIISKDYIRDNPGVYPVYSSQTENEGNLGNISTYDYDGEYLTWTTDGANAGTVFYRNAKFNVTNVCGLLKVKIKSVISKFLYYFLVIKAPKYVNEGMGNPKLMSNVMERIKVPVPPLEIQKEIVRILDNFLDIISELIEELTIRKKQYSWYRDYLLNFENKVEIVKLKDIAIEMYRGNGIKREEVRVTGIPCVRYGEIYTEYGISFEKTKSYTDENLITNKKYIEYGDILFAITGESVEEIGKSTAYIGKEKCLVGGDILVMKHKQDPVYLSYVLSTENAQKQKSKGKIKSKVVHTNATDIGEIEIPLPPLEVQKRIVEVLDNFEKICNDLNIGLPAEIEARQKQYEYYRNIFLTFNNEEIYALSKQASKQAQNLIKILQYVYGYVEVRLGDIGKVSMCRRVLKSETNPIKGIPFFKIGTFGKKEDAYISIKKFYEYKEKYSYPKKGMILISTSGTIGRTVVFDGKPAYYQDSNIVWIDNNEERVLNKYLYYFYQTNPWKIDIGGTIERLYNENIEKTSIPLPPLEEQQKIVDILDRFDKLCNDISEGLPAEIEARQKQYEYFREKLLTFKNIND